MLRRPPADASSVIRLRLCAVTCAAPWTSTGGASCLDLESRPCGRPIAWAAACLAAVGRVVVVEGPRVLRWPVLPSHQLGGASVDGTASLWMAPRSSCGLESGIGAPIGRAAAGGGVPRRWRTARGPGASCRSDGSHRSLPALPVPELAPVPAGGGVERRGAAGAAPIAAAGAATAAFAIGGGPAALAGAAALGCAAPAFALAGAACSRGA